ncbi:MAG: aminoacyl-tRNA hydrolase [Bacteroidales bacterium]|nr:aminoacyl-tRNA hydrolase [Bacteroidales bacterium]
MDDNRKFLIVGLGNAEDKYTGTRHNIGFEVVNALAVKLDAKFEMGRHAYVAHAKYKGRSLTLILPTTYMNLSGKAVKYWLTQEKIEAKSMLVVSDDLDLPVGDIKMKPKGGPGSHNGLGHIGETLGHQVDYVLAKFPPEEKPLIDAAVEKSVNAILCFVTVGIEKAMNQANTK